MSAGDGAQIPEGFEIVEITNDPEFDRAVSINNCGQIVFSKRMPLAQVFLYDNGALSKLSPDPEVADDFPDINDEATVVWSHGFDGRGGGTVVVYEEGVITPLGPGEWPRINGPGNIAWNRFTPEPCAYPSDIFFWDGKTVRQITNDGFSNQGVEINDLDELVWTRYDFCQSPWVSHIMVYSRGQIIPMPTGQLNPQIPAINNDTLVAWGGSGGIELWAEGVTTLLTDWGRNPRLNNLGDIHFLRWHDESQTWQGWLYVHSGEFYQVTNDPFWNTDGAINDFGEVAWNARRYPEGDIHFMRRVRTGDPDFDGDVDLDDYGVFLDCFTGPGRVDRLCECRFLDIDHDADVDFHDFALLQVNFTGSQ